MALSHDIADRLSAPAGAGVAMTIAMMIITPPAGPMRVS
jgi:hypothetical protein